MPFTRTILRAFWKASKTVVVRNALLKITHTHTHIYTLLLSLILAVRYGPFRSVRVPHSWVASEVLRSSTTFHVPDYSFHSVDDVRCVVLITVLSAATRLSMRSFECAQECVPGICSTHTFERTSDWLATLRAVKNVRVKAALETVVAVSWLFMYPMPFWIFIWAKNLLSETLMMKFWNWKIWKSVVILFWIFKSGTLQTPRIKRPYQQDGSVW